MMHKPGRAAADLLAMAALALSAPAVSRTPPPAAPVRYIDAHSHLIDTMTPDAEIAAFRAAGLAGVVIMDPDATVLTQLARRNRGYVVPFISLARLPQLPGLHLSASTAQVMGDLRSRGAVCGFGEIPTRLMPRREATDDLALLNPDRRKIYARAAALRTPINMHIDIASRQVAASVDRIASENPGAVIILAHAGWSASPEVIARLMADHPNIHADLSVRLDPARGLPPEPQPAGAQPPGAGNVISIVQADGTIQPAWRAVIERFPDRFLFGMDVTMAERPRHMAELLATARLALGGMGPRVENAVAHGNVERLLAGCPAGPRS